MSRNFVHDAATDEKVNLGNNFDYPVATEWSVGAIFRTNGAVSGDQQSITSLHGPSSEYRQFQLEIDNDTLQMTVLNASSERIRGATFSANTWYITVLAADGTTDTGQWHLFTVPLNDLANPIDNDVDSTGKPVNVSFRTADVVIGGRDGGGNEMDGDIAHGFTIKHRLTLAEIQQFARNPLGTWIHWVGQGYVDADCYYLPLEGNTDPEPDLSGNGHNGTIEGTPTKGDNPPVLYPTAQILQFPSAGAADTTAPVLSSPTGTKTGSTTADGTVSTDEGNGTMYAIVDTSATPPSVAQIQAGQDSGGAAADWSGNQAISTTGTKTFNATGLTASTTYYFYFQHTDSSSNDSTVASSTSFTTDAAGAVVTAGSLMMMGVGI